MHLRPVYRNVSATSLSATHTNQPMQASWQPGRESFEKEDSHWLKQASLQSRPSAWVLHRRERTKVAPICSTIPLPYPLLSHTHTPIPSLSPPSSPPLPHPHSWIKGILRDYGLKNHREEIHNWGDNFTAYDVRTTLQKEQIKISWKEIWDQWDKITSANLQLLESCLQS